MAWWNIGRQPPRVDKAGSVTTPPGKVQKSKYGDKKSVKAKNPKKKDG